MTLKNYIKRQSLNSIFLRSFIDFYKSLRLLKYYTLSFKFFSRKKKTLYVMIDGRTAHGGLSDRFCGIISAYKYAKEIDIPFKVYFIYPYCLDLLLDPNLYNWKVEANEVQYQLPASSPLYISQFGYNSSKAFDYFRRKMHRLKGDIHLYTNAHYFRNEEFGPLFSELFKPVEILNKQIMRQLEFIGGICLSLFDFSNY